MANYHTDAAALIAKAAEESGLLGNVAAALELSDNSGHHTGPTCLACLSLGRLMLDFYEHLFAWQDLLEKRAPHLSLVAEAEAERDPLTN